MPHRHSLDSRSGRSSSVRQARDANQGGRMTRYRQSMDSASYRPEQYHRPSRDFRQSSAQSFDSSQFRQSADFLQPSELHDLTPYRQSSDFNRPTRRSLRYSQKQQAPTQDPYLSPSPSPSKPKPGSSSSSRAAPDDVPYHPYPHPQNPHP